MAIRDGARNCDAKQGGEGKVVRINGYFVGLEWIKRS